MPVLTRAAGAKSEHVIATASVAKPKAIQSQEPGLSIWIGTAAMTAAL
ncbi:MAG: hypothetical protein ACLPPF_21055 [Rhodomicrobium sp.]